MKGRRLLTALLCGFAVIMMVGGVGLLPDLAAQEGGDPPPPPPGEEEP